MWVLPAPGAIVVSCGTVNEQRACFSQAEPRPDELQIAVTDVATLVYVTVAEVDLRNDQPADHGNGEQPEGKGGLGKQCAVVQQQPGAEKELA